MLDPVDLTLHPAGPVARRESPTTFAVADKVQRIADRVFLLHESRLPAVFEVVAVARAHVLVANPAKVDPHVRELMREERARVEQFMIVNSFPLVSLAISPITLRRQRMRWRAESKD